MVRVTRASMTTAAAAARKDAKRSVSSPVRHTGTSSTKKRKRERFEGDNTTESFQAPSYFKAVSNFTDTTSPKSSTKSSTTPSTSTITRQSIQRLIEAHVNGGVFSNNGVMKDSKTNSRIDTRTMGGWCLIDALLHCAKASNGVLAPLIMEHGPPSFYLDFIREKHGKATQTKNMEEKRERKEDYPCFRALCRTVAGQQLAGAAAATIWRRLVDVVVENVKEGNSNKKGISDPSVSTLQAFTPKALLSVVQNAETLDLKNGPFDTDKLRKPAGLSRAKCDCILEIARSYQSGSLSEDFLMRQNNDTTIRERLLSIKGLGPWSVDMFLMFRCHRSNVLPIGDLALRNGTAVLWKLNRSLSAKKDAAIITKYHSSFEPYRSVSSYYMYKVVDATNKLKKTKKSKK